ncbi:inositol monophosphatase family protein [Mesorhizobium sp.]|uniref:inositol monophosphatase family protein n=1 Tax=Mesorhizobium sp. TaxID=1871066 RepID=UPI000FE6CB6A|nr:MAG: hypothetical protein EOR48_32150 [Mesorhizobium sp.]
MPARHERPSSDPARDASCGSVWNGTDLDANDICALCPVVTEAGGVISDWAGHPLTIAASGAIVASASPSSMSSF